MSMSTIWAVFYFYLKKGQSQFSSFKKNVWNRSNRLPSLGLEPIFTAHLSHWKTRFTMEVMTDL